jgi:hypothetical protein
MRIQKVILSSGFLQVSPTLLLLLLLQECIFAYMLAILSAHKPPPLPCGTNILYSTVLEF